MVGGTVSDIERSARAGLSAVGRSESARADFIESQSLRGQPSSDAPYGRKRYGSGESRAGCGTAIDGKSNIRRRGRAGGHEIVIHVADFNDRQQVRERNGVGRRSREGQVVGT